MATSNLTTPGVYIQELNSFPPSVAPVSTAIPAFIGYTEKGPVTPTRITSMLEYRSIFGGGYNELYTVTNSASDTFVSVAPTTSESPYTLFYHLEMYFGNGGGPCYIISVGNYDSSQTISAADFYDLSDPTIGIGKAEEVDEVTLLVAPEVAELSSAAQIRSIYDAMLAQCAKLMDRFCIFDVNVQNAGNPLPVSDGNNFRNTNIGANSLDYGSAYYPPLDTVLSRSYSNDEVLISGGSYSTAPNNRLSTIAQGKGAYSTVTVGTLTAADILTVTSGSTTVDFSGYNDELDVIDAINSHPALSLLVRAQFDTAGSFFIVDRAATTAATSTLVVNGTAGYTGTTVATGGALHSANTALYATIVNAITARILTLGASATMAGIYASVDNDRGVWKAPANVSVANIIGPSVPVTEAQQGSLNVDAVGGKSINVIRSFTGRGTLVWGARTLDGNSNEWRYIPVRRLFIMAEESIKKACEFVVFEPNDKNTWLRVKALASNFLTDLWRQGALAGAKPEQAFFVQVGLGETMTAQDILEGKMIVRIGMAAVRPAEFIILQFVQQLQQS